VIVIRTMGAPATIPRRKLSISDYHRMGEAGILREDDRIELIHGELIEMAPIGSRHMATVTRLTHVLIAAVGSNAIVSTQNPISLPPDSEPQPDIALLKPRNDYYAESLPGPADVLLLIEVADTTLAYDRDVKLQLYGQHGITEVWLIDLQRSAIPIYRDPSPQCYRSVSAPGMDETIGTLALPHIRFDSGTLFG
jgi:Uma2 family endonuclease